MNREFTMKQAQHTLSVCDAKYKENIQDSFERTAVYDNYKLDKHTLGKPDIKLVDMRTLDAVSKYSEGKTAVLNFASFRNPGGGFLTGAMAQEESLCHKTTLFKVLDGFRDTFYATNLKRLNRNLYDNRALYTPDIVYWGGTAAKTFDVLTCAAPNFNGARKHRVTQKENYEALKSRIEFVLDILEAQGCETVILGAFGCGVFGQNPFDVARLFKQLASNRSFKHIVYAVPDKSSENYRAFKMVFGR